MKYRTSLPIAAFLLTLLSVPAFAETRVEKEFSLAPGGTLALLAEGGSVSVAGVPGSMVRLVVTTKRDDFESRYNLTFVEGPNRLEITAKRKGEKVLSLFRWTRSDEVRFDIEVPVRTTLDLDTSGGSLAVEGTEGDVRLDTSGGAITVHGVRGGVNADTSGGSISIADVDGDVVADTSGGSITIESVRGKVHGDTSGGSVSVADVTGDLAVETSGGSIRITNAGGRVEGDTSGGSIEASLAAGNSRGGSLSASGGGIRLTLDPAADLEIDASASGGSVVSTLAVAAEGGTSKTRLRGKLGDGGPSLTLRTSGGSIHIDPR